MPYWPASRVPEPNNLLQQTGAALQPLGADDLSAAPAAELGHSAACWRGRVLLLAPETVTALIAGAVGIVVAIVAILALDRLWPPLLRREFTVELPLEKAWQHLTRVEHWPS